MASYTEPFGFTRGHQQPPSFASVVLRVTSLPSCLEALKNAGVAFCDPLEAGPGSPQVHVDEPDGNPIELFEAVAQSRDANDIGAQRA